MRNNDLKNTTTDQLKSYLYVNKAITIALIIGLTLFMAITIYGFIEKENKSTFIALFAVAFSCWSFLPIPFISMKKIKTELKLRENTN